MTRHFRFVRSCKIFIGGIGGLNFEQNPSAEKGEFDRVFSVVIHTFFISDMFTIFVFGGDVTRRLRDMNIVFFFRCSWFAYAFFPFETLTR